MLVLFTTVGSVLYVLEAANTFSVFRRDHGRTYVPLIYELLVTLPLVHIPQAAINYFVARCRQQNTTTYQTLCGTFSIMFVFIRLVWYAHQEGKLLRADDKRKVKNAFVMLVCALYAMSMAFYIMNWRYSPGATLLDDQVKNISIFMLKAPFLENEYVSRYNVDHLLALQGWSRKQPELIPSVLKIKSAPTPPGVLMPYYCKHNATFVPFECHPPGVSHLAFRFMYVPHIMGSPYGEIIYNLAAIYSNGSCSETGSDLADGWRLWYFNVKRAPRGGNVLLTSHWPQTCTVPKPWYNGTISVCDVYREVGLQNYASMVITGDDHHRYL